MAALVLGVLELMAKHNAARLTGLVEMIRGLANPKSVGARREVHSHPQQIKLLIFVGGTCGSVHVQTLNNNLRELGVLESKRNTIRRGLVHELLNAQDTVLCSYFAQRSGARGEGRGRESTVGEAFQGLDYFE